VSTYQGFDLLTLTHLLSEIYSVEGSLKVGDELLLFGEFVDGVSELGGEFARLDSSFSY